MPHPRYTSEASAICRRLFAYPDSFRCQVIIPLHPQGTGGVPPDTPCMTVWARVWQFGNKKGCFVPE